MNFASLPRRLLSHWPRAMLCAALFCAGCEREQIRAYTVPKDKPAPDPGVAVRPRSVPRPQVTWTLPPGWQETGPGQMSIAGFLIPGPSGQQAEVSITPLPPMKAGESMIVNMWRQQVGLEPLNDEDVQKQFNPVEIGGEQGKLFEIARNANEPIPKRTITAMVHHEDSSLFYKLSGDAALVEAQKPAFLAFLKTIQVKPAAAASVPTSSASARFNWQVPAHWKPQPAGEFQVARFDLPERGGAKAEVFVSVFGSDTGGTLANVNRWRRELGLRDVDDNALPPLLVPLDPAEPDARLIDLTNNNRRLIAAIVPRAGQFWFYKLRGDFAAVAPERDAFVAFVKSRP